MKQFLIQSDFVTNVHRQGIMDCPRNSAIFGGVGDAFVDAVLQFCQHPTLQYQWMRFYPTSSIFGFNWEMRSNITRLLSAAQVLRPYNHGPLKRISELRIVPDEFKCVSGKPLFMDSPESTYIANEYQGEDTSILISLGLRNLELLDVTERVQQDLASPSSTLKAREPPRDWYPRAAKYLLESFGGGCIPWLKRMKFVPLESGEFTSVLEEPIYFPQSNGMPIPTDLGLRLVKLGTIEDNEWREKLFAAVGVTAVSTQQVRKLIFEKYKSEDSRQKITLYQSVAHLRYLYWTHESFTSSPKQVNFSTLPTNSRLGTDAVGSRTAPATTSSTNLFGKASPATGSLFGGYTGNLTSPWELKIAGGVSNDKSAFGLFGSTKTTKPASLFGAATSSSGVFSSTAPVFPSGSVFGDSNQSASRPVPTFGGSLFSSLNSTGTGSGLGFASAATPSGSSLFNFPSSRDTPKQVSAFGGAASSSLKPGFLPNPFGDSLFGTSGSVSITSTQQPVTVREILKAPGTKNVSFQPTIEDEPNSKTHQQNAFQSICFQKQYELFSYEELRLADDLREEYHYLWVFDQKRLVPRTTDVYFNSKGDFGIQELLKWSPDGSYPGLSLSLLNSAYFEAVPKSTSGSLTWESWLQNQLGILQQPRLLDPNDPAKLSVVFRFIVNHRPDKLLGILKTNWASYERILSPEPIKVISNVDVPVTGGNNRKLSSTFLPVLAPRAQKFLRGKERLPFLTLHPQSSADEWRFLEKFGACHTENLDFYLAILSCISKENRSAKELSDPERIFELYEAIFSKRWSSEKDSGYEEIIR